MSLLLVAAFLAGCTTDFRVAPSALLITNVSVKFAGNFTIINFTLTDRANFSIGSEARDPFVDLYFYEMATRQDPHSATGLSLSAAKGRNVRTYFREGGAAWPPRFYDKTTAEMMGGSASPSQYWGPLELGPGEGRALEYAIIPSAKFSGTSGLYDVYIRASAPYPPEILKNYSAPFPDDAKYYTGCFNHDTAEYYGDRQPPGYPSCPFVNTKGLD